MRHVSKPPWQDFHVVSVSLIVAWELETPDYICVRLRESLSRATMCPEYVTPGIAISELVTILDGYLRFPTHH